MSVDWQRIDNDGLMLWVMHEFASRFRNHAILKGGMQLMLMSSARATNDLDYVFVPYKSKKEIAPRIEALLGEIPEAVIEKSMHSHNGRYRVKVGMADVQIEFNVSSAVPSVELTTELLATKLNALPRVIRVMSPDVALAHKLAAWNERRLIRDLYDAYYMYTIMGAKPDRGVLVERLNNMNSALPELKKVRKMTVSEFTLQFSRTVAQLTDEKLSVELGPLLTRERLLGFLPVLKAKLNELTFFVQRLDDTNPAETED